MKKTYNPFKLIGSYIGAFLGPFLILLVLRMSYNPTISYLDQLIFVIKDLLTLQGLWVLWLIFLIIGLVAGFLIGWVIEILFKKW